MTDPISRCVAHGFVEGTTCPHCDRSPTSVLRGDRRQQLSKFLSGALRHFPEEAGLKLDENGWVAWSAVAQTITDRYAWATPTHLEAIVVTDLKGRFEQSPDNCLRAAYGHSVEVSLEPTDAAVPDALYHGTAPTNLQSIRADGLVSMDRKQVHRAGSLETATAVGRRHASEPVILTVDAARMLADGYDIQKRGVETYTTEWVPPRYLEATG